MASRLIWSGRVAFFALMALQAYSLAAYPATYERNDGFYALVLLYLPAIILWLFIMFQEENVQWLFVVWILYVWIGLVPFIGTIFGRTDTIEDKLIGAAEKSTKCSCNCSCCSSINSSLTNSSNSSNATNDEAKFFGPNILKMTLCITPVLLLLLLSTGTDSISYREKIWMLSVRIALDLFDGVEMLEVILEENELSHAVPWSFERAIIAFVCISFLLSPLELMEINSDVFNKCMSALRITFHIILVNCVFLGLRLALFLVYRKDASIFIAKNGIVIILGFFEICSTLSCCGCEDDYY